MDSNILIAWGAASKKYGKGEIIFEEGEEVRSYFQIETGQVKMYNSNEEGKEFIQGFFEEGESFGEPPLFISEPYPASAIATKESVIWRIAKERFFKILDEYRQIERDFLILLAQRVYSKAKKAKFIVDNTPEFRILSFLDEYKKNHSCNLSKRIIIPYTRQEIANFTGLRVETVIRTLTLMKEQKKVDIIERKLYY